MTRHAGMKAILEYGGGICVYCGDPATTVDHIDPWCAIHDNGEDNLVPCCKVCNSIAGGKVFDSGLAKQRYILGQRQRRKWQRRLQSQPSVIIDMSYHRDKPQRKVVHDVTEQRCVATDYPTIPEPSEDMLALLRRRWDNKYPVGYLLMEKRA